MNVASSQLADGEKLFIEASRSIVGHRPMLWSPCPTRLGSAPILADAEEPPTNGR